jgi:hypothetical protein
MILSSLITPFRIYSEYHEIEKFRKGCGDLERFELITDKTRLLPFQFRRDKSIFPLAQVWLRQECKDFYEKLLSHNVSKFITNDSSWFIQYATIQAGSATLSVGTNGYISQSNLLTVGQKYKVKVTVNEMNLQNAFVLKIRNGLNPGDPETNITAPGTTVFEFTATDTSVLLQHTLSGSDTIKVEEFQVYKINEINAFTDDYEIDLSAFNMVSTSTKDIITYCGSTFDSTLPCGKYYLIMKSYNNAGEEVYYFSEIITIKNFVPDQSSYVFIEWKNGCDLQNVKYTGLSCDYVNRLYLEGPVSKPRYPFNQDVEKDGEQNEIPTFQKWEKSQILHIGKAPEFITDCVTAMPLHDDIKFYFPIKEHQIKIDFTNDVNQVESITSDLEDVFNDCAANMEVTLLLNERIIDTTCCEEIVLSDNCVHCSYLLEGLCINSEDAKICPKDGGLPGYDFYLLVGEEYVLSDPPTGTLICFTDLPSLYFNGTSWVNAPSLSSFTNSTNTISLQGNFYNNTAVQLVFTKGAYVYTHNVLYSAAQLAAGIVIQKSTLPAILFTDGVLEVKAHSLQGSCDYGYSNTLEVCYGDGC